MYKKIVYTNEVFPIVESKDYLQFWKSFKEEGIQKPIIVVLRNKKQWDEDKTRYPHILDFPSSLKEDSVIYQCRCGNNRLKFAKEAGLTELLAMVCELDDEVAYFCNEQQRWWLSHEHESS